MQHAVWQLLSLLGGQGILLSACPPQGLGAEVAVHLHTSFVPIDFCMLLLVPASAQALTSRDPFLAVWQSVSHALSFAPCPGILCCSYGVWKWLCVVCEGKRGLLRAGTFLRGWRSPGVLLQKPFAEFRSSSLQRTATEGATFACSSGNDHLRRE